MIPHGSPLFELVSNEDFSAGTIIFEWVDGFMRKSVCSSAFLTNTEIFKSPKKVRAAARGKNLFYYEVEGDQHQGHKFMAFYEILNEDDKMLQKVVALEKEGYSIAP